MQFQTNSRRRAAFVACAIVGGAASLFASSALASPTGSATISEVPDGPDFQYSVVLKDTSTPPATSSNTIGTFWFAWVPGKNFLHTAPLSVSSPTGWTDNITHGGNNDGYAIQWVSSSSATYVQAGNTLSGVSFITADPPSSVFANSFFYTSTPTLTSFVYEADPEGDPGDEFVVQTPEPTAIGMTAIGVAGLLIRRRKAR